jgi:phosphocarrier protein
MTKKTVKIVNKLGLHARPSALLVTTASKFQSEIHFTKESLRVNGKSIMGVMMLAAEQGSEIIVEADGADEETAVDALIEVINTGFNEMD